MSNKLLFVAVGDGISASEGGHLYADPYMVDLENRLYLNGVYIAWYGQEDDSSMTYDAFCDLIEGLKMAFPGLEVEERQVKFSVDVDMDDWTWEKVEKLLQINQPKSKRIGRIALDIGYVVDLDNTEMVDHARESIIDDITEVVARGGSEEVLARIKMEEAPGFIEADIPDFLLEETEDWLKGDVEEEGKEE